MMLAAMALLGVMFLTDADEQADAALKARLAEQADSGMAEAEAAHKSARITSRTADFDREAGVMMFEGDVFVRYADAYDLRADRIFVFMSGTNALSRIVASGNISITNETRSGACDLAVFRNRSRELTLFGEGEDRLAKLVDGKTGDALEGSRIRFWLDSEQVEVTNSRISADVSGGGREILR